MVSRHPGGRKKQDSEVAASTFFSNSDLPRNNFASLHGVAHEIVGIKLEPIVALPTSCIVGMEVLSQLSAPHDNEQFFQHLSASQSLKLLKAQLATLKNALYVHDLFINLPITVLTEVESFSQLLPMLSPELNIEIVEPESFFELSENLRERAVRHLRILSDRGCRIWLDDVDEAIAHQFLTCRLPLCGIKIDKMAFWRLRATPALAQLVNLCSHIANHVLIEGIESNRDRECALQAGAGFGQGYYWPSMDWPGE